MIELNAGPARVTVRPEAGGRLSSVCLAGLDLVVTEPEANGDALGWGVYPMAPWAGRVRNRRFRHGERVHRLPPELGPHALHGTVFRRPWDVTSASDRACRLVCDLGEIWPFPGRAVEEIELDGSGLHLRLSVEASEEPMPVVLGWHPWFARDLAAGGPVEIDFAAGARWERDATGLPNGRKVAPGPRPVLGWDDCFTDVQRPPTLTWPGALQLTLTANVDHWVVYDAGPAGVCVEPQTNPPDGLNRGADLVEPGRPLTMTFHWSWQLG